MASPDIQRGRPDSVIKARFEVWLASDMDFNEPPGHNIVTFKKFTKAEKIPYTADHMIVMNRMEDMPMSMYQRYGTRSVTIKMAGFPRYVWRTDVLTKKEYEVAKAKQKEAFGRLRGKSNGDVDQGSGQD